MSVAGQLVGVAEPRFKKGKKREAYRGIPAVSPTL